MHPFVPAIKIWRHYIYVERSLICIWNQPSIERVLNVKLMLIILFIYHSLLKFDHEAVWYTICFFHSSEYFLLVLMDVNIPLLFHHAIDR